MKYHDRQWSQEVKERDQYVCQWPTCASQYALEAAHIIPRWKNSTRLLNENGITLCRRHHREMDNMSSSQKRQVLIILVGYIRYAKLEELAAQIA